jgi:histidinol dehydrogenase
MQNIETIVKEIIENVKKNGDDSLVYYSEKFDGEILKKDELILDVKDFEFEIKNISSEVLNALKNASENIKNYHEAQIENITANSFKFNKKDCQITEKITPIERVGVYVPGGRYSYPSTALMTVIPARCAGVKEILVATPLKNLTTVLKVSLYLAGADKVLCVGGAQGIAGMAFGTELVKKVDMIIGPGNAFVTEAKRQVFGKVGIDMLAGPSDVLIYADETVDVDWIASDMNAQAEHDSLSKAILVSQSLQILDAVKIKIMPEFLDRVVFVNKKNINECAEYINENAPEHLEILTTDEKKQNELLDKIKNAGAIFVGEYGTVAFGDYFIGPSHTLPTGENARFCSGLSVNTFLKRTAVMKVNKNYVAENGKFVELIAGEEGLKFHEKSVRLRR